jgi:hypothetical protein
MSLASSFEQDFRTVECLRSSGTPTAFVDAYCICLIKAERQMRRIFTHVVFQSPAFGLKDIDSLIAALSNNDSVFLRGVIRGFNALFSLTLSEIYGTTEYAADFDALKQSKRLRNKLFHGQLSGDALSAHDLDHRIKAIMHWCSQLAVRSQAALGYDGFARDSFQKSSCPNRFANLKCNLSSILDYHDFIKKHMEG